MRKSLLVLAPTSLLLLAVTGTALASANAQITITASVVASTCDVSLSTNNLDLGNYTASQFSSVATPISESQHPFTVGINNCQAPKAAGDTASLVVTGQTLAGYSNMFNNTDTNTGVMLSLASTPSSYITNGQKLLVATAGEKPAASDFNGKTLSLNAGLASTTTSGVSLGAVNAPILFSFAYN